MSIRKTLMSLLSKRTVKVLIILCFVFTAFAVGQKAISSLNKPAIGVVYKSVDTKISPETNKELITKYFKLEYPKRYEVGPSPTGASLQASSLQAHQATGGRSSSRILLIVTELPPGGVKEGSNYGFYKAHPELYQLSSASYSGETVTEVKREAPSYEYVVLWPHGTYLLTASLTSSTRTEILDGELQLALSSLKWQL